MEKLTKDDGESADLLADNIEKLREIFPEVFADGQVDFDALRQTLGEYGDDQEERYSFTWHGKSRARQIAQMPSTGTLRPCPEESVNWDSTKNVFIEGDNLEVLKLLQKSYHRKVKMIYIDPPYNTGKEFIYPDKWQDNLETYLRYTGQVDDGGLKLSANAETSGRHHTNWLNMMYPRLRLARNLLREDGALFVSIDENEVANLKKICDEIYGEENLLGRLVWKNATDNNPTNIAVEHEYVLVYSKNRDLVEAVWKSDASDIKKTLVDVGNKLLAEHSSDDDLKSAYKAWFRENKPQLWPLDGYKHIDRGGVYAGVRGVHNPGKEGYRYDVVHPKTGVPCAQPLMGYRFPEETMKTLLDEGRIIFGEDHTKIIELKAYAEDYQEKLPSVIEIDGRSGAYDVRSLFPEYTKAFDNPKPVRFLLSFLPFLLKSDDDIVLDFFAGSCSTAHAAMELSARDGLSRRFIMVQLPEPCAEKSEPYKAGIKSISELSKERIRRVVQQLEKDEKRRPPGIGFRAFRLSSSNIKPWNANFDSIESDLVEAIDNVIGGRSEHDVLYELLLKYGLDLAISTETQEIEGRNITVIGAGALVVCLADDITLEVVSGIAALKDELKPEVMRVVFKDSGFADDVVKTNASQILRQAGIHDVKSL